MKNLIKSRTIRTGLMLKYIQEQSEVQQNDRNKYKRDSNRKVKVKNKLHLSSLNKNRAPP